MGETVVAGDMGIERGDETVVGVGSRALFEHSPDGILVHDPETGSVVDANGVAAELLDEERDALCGRTLSELRPPEAPAADIVAQALADGSARTEWRLDRPDGRRWVDVRVVTTGDAALTYLRDLTEQNARERRLQETDAILTQLTETTDDVFWLFDGHFTELQFVNDAYEDIWGRPIEAVREDPMDFLRGVHPDDRDTVTGAIERLRLGESTDREYRVNPEEGYSRWVWVRGEPIFDESGNVERVAGVSRDITERKEREQDLQRSELQFEAVFNDPQLLVALLDTDGRIERINETALGHAAADRGATEGVHFPETPWWDHDETLQADLREWLDRAADGEYVEYEADHPQPGGGMTTVEGTIRPVTDDDGTVRSLIASARDVTARKERARGLEESNERLERFAYVASHDLQEPLRTISNFVELIEDEYSDELDDEAERLIDVVVTGSERMQSMINGLLDYSRVTTRGNEFEPVDTDAVVADVIDEADSDQLRQLVQNLVKNALEHSDGPGIEPTRQGKIFRIFKSGTQYQTSSQAKRIGLAICESIVHRHGGDIWVESAPGDGATFVFTIETDS